ncbi:MAG: membrane protein insertase YidC [Muribaculaceae bacterium]|nr:membrane protein insertase YidC [Muribaculaceae bacterium]
MDKNTVWGLILMALVMFGFMYMSQPSAEEKARMEKERQEQLMAESREDTAPAVQRDTISAAEITQTIATIRNYGETDTTTSIASLNINNLALKVGLDNRISGQITIDGGAIIPAEAIIYNNLENIPETAADKAVKALRSALSGVARYRGFARYLSGDSTVTRLENDLISLDISNKGGIIAEAALKKYNRADSSAVKLMSAGETGYSFILSSEDSHFDTREFYFTPIVESDSTVLMNLDLGNGASWGLIYTLPQDGYTVKMDVVQKNMTNVIPANVSEMEFNWHNRMHRNEAGRVFEERNSGLFYMLGDGDVDNLSENKNDGKEVTERLRWIACKNQFFSAVLISENQFTSASLDSEVLEHDPEYLKNMNINTTLEYSSTVNTPASFTFYLGPNSYPLLNNLEDEIMPGQNLHLTKLIPLGWSLFRWINTWIVIPTFDLLGKFLTNYGVIILLLTIFIKIILFPFTYKSYQSQAKMRILAPEIKAINDKYPGNDNAMKRNQETMALYSRAGANPMSGCLPLLLQMPILVAMFNFFPSAIELRGQSFLWAHDLSAPDAIVSWTANIPFISSTFGNHISLFCLLMTATNIIYTYINMQSQAQSAAMPGMKMMMYLMPLMFLVFFNNYAAALSYYYFLSLLITIVQTWFVRRMISEEKVRATMKENARKPRKKSGFMARLEEAQRRQQQLLKEQERQRGKRR